MSRHPCVYFLDIFVSYHTWTLQRFHPRFSVTALQYSFYLWWLFFERGSRTLQIQTTLGNCKLCTLAYIRCAASFPCNGSLTEGYHGASVSRRCEISSCGILLRQCNVTFSLVDM